MEDKKSAEERIGEFLRFGSRLGLERMNELMRRLGDPQDSLKVFHIAGTNGKGSVSRYIYESLVEAGYHVGLYTSPYLEKFNERIEADRKLISDEELELCTDEVLEKVREMTADGYDSPTEFEVVTAVAFVYFSRLGLDAVVLEVGLGGRGDSTNIVKSPVVSVITSISYDHMDRLGSTIPEIASEKAGIIKRGVPVVVSTEREEALSVFASKASSVSARLIDARNVSTFEIKELRPDGATFDYEYRPDGAMFDYEYRPDRAEFDYEYKLDGASSDFKNNEYEKEPDLAASDHEHSEVGNKTHLNSTSRDDDIPSEQNIKTAAASIDADQQEHRIVIRNIEIGMGGEHQVMNAAEALTALMVQDQFTVSEDAVKRGLARAKQPGRFEVMYGPYADLEHESIGNIDGQRAAGPAHSKSGMSNRPWIILDGAHNQDAARRLKEAVHRFFPGKKVLFVCGILKDKDVDGILDQFIAIGTDFIATEPLNDRKLSAHELAREIHERGKLVYEIPRPRDAAALAMSIAEQYDVVLFTGSLYLIGLIRTLLREKYLAAGNVCFDRTEESDDLTPGLDEDD